MPVPPLAADALRPAGLAPELAFETTAELEDLGAPLGQVRAIALARALAAPPGPALVEASSARALDLAAALARLSAALVVLPASGTYAAGAALEAVLALGAAVLLVR